MAYSGTFMDTGHPRSVKVLREYTNFDHRQPAEIVTVQVTYAPVFPVVLNVFNFPILVEYFAENVGVVTNPLTRKPMRSKMMSRPRNPNILLREV